MKIRNKQTQQTVNDVYTWNTAYYAVTESRDGTITLYNMMHWEPVPEERWESADWTIINGATLLVLDRTIRLSDGLRWKLRNNLLDIEKRIT